jgi:hypothetical protein
MCGEILFQPAGLRDAGDAGSIIAVTLIDLHLEYRPGVARQLMRRPSKTDMRALDQNDVIRLLRSEVKRAGGQKKWARKKGIVPSTISMVLSGYRPPNKKIISALKLRRVIVFERVR